MEKQESANISSLIESLKYRLEMPSALHKKIEEKSKLIQDLQAEAENMKMKLAKKHERM